MITTLWTALKNQEKVFCVCVNDSIIIESPHSKDKIKYATLNLFLNKESAVYYKKYLCEKHDHRPSTLFIKNVKAEDILGDKEILKTLAEEKYDSNIKIMISELDDDGDVLVTDVLYDSLALLN